MKRIDHLIVRVDDLHAGVKEFTDAGFAVFYGVRKEKAYNALIYLQDHSFLELVDMKAAPGFAKTLVKLGVIRLISTAFDRLGHYLFKDERLLDYVIYSADIDTSQARFGKHSTKVLRIGKRKKPNGTVVRWRMFFPNDFDLPFVMTDYTPEKISADETDVHPNGITGLHTIEVAFADEPETFRRRLVDFYQVDEGRVSANGKRFHIQTENATIRYTPSDQYKVTSAVLKPHVPELDAMLSKYSLSTSD